MCVTPRKYLVIKFLHEFSTSYAMLRHKVLQEKACGKELVKGRWFGLGVGVHVEVSHATARRKAAHVTLEEQHGKKPSYGHNHTRVVSIKDSITWCIP